MPNPLISIIITTHDRPATLLRAIRSVKSRIKVPKEIIVLSDRMDVSAQKDVSDLLSSEDSFLFTPKLRGPAETRNLGINMSRGEFIVLFDDDDEFPDFDQHYGPLIEDAMKSRDMVTYSNVLIREEDRVNPSYQDVPSYMHSLQGKKIEDIYLKNFILTPACLIPSFLAKQCQQDPFLRSLEDWDFLLNLMSRCDFRFSDHIGAIIYKDFVNQGVRRSTTVEAKGFDLVLDYLYIYRRWRAPSEALREARSALLAEHGILLPSPLL